MATSAVSGVLQTLSACCRSVLRSECQALSVAITGTRDEWVLMRVTDADVAPDDRVASGGWAEIERREAKLGIHVGAPLLLRPDASVDPRLGSFLRRSRFAMRSPGTQWAYVLDYRLFFSFLWARGKDWDEATEDDVYDWEHWRRRDTANPRRIGGAKWAREVAALHLLYEWAVDATTSERARSSPATFGCTTVALFRSRRSNLPAPAPPRPAHR
jgi:hypothetical protein